MLFRKFFGPLSVFALVSIVAAAGSQPAPAYESVLLRLEKSFNLNDASGYLGNFAPEISERESQNLDYYSSDLGMKSLELRLAGSSGAKNGGLFLFLQAYFSNDLSVLIEGWLMELVSDGEGYSIVRRETATRLGPLFKLNLSPDKAVAARKIEIDHKDINIVFDQASAFYDNVPGLETALVVIGKGTLDFKPSDDEEKHQLDLIYGKKFFHGSLNSIYLRCSSSFMAANVRIEEAASRPPPGPAEFQEAVRIFARNYPRSFTVENPLSDELLSFIPQGEEAVIEMSGKRTGELVYIYSPFAEEEVNFYDRKKKRIVSLYSPSEEVETGGSKRFFISFDEKFDVESYDLHLEYRPGQSWLSARAGVSISSKVEALANVKLRFNPAFKITGVTDGAGRLLFYTMDRLRSLLYVYFIKPLMTSESETLNIIYQGNIIPPPPATDNISQLEVSGDVLLQPRYETFFFSQSGNWYPSPPKDDFFTCRLRVSVPAEYNCVAVGELQVEKPGEIPLPGSADQSQGLKSFSFSSDEPVKYMSFLVGKFGLIKETPWPIPVKYYASTELMEKKPFVFDQAVNIVGFFSRIFGPYPFGKLDVVLRSWPTAGGFSPPSYVIVNDVPWLVKERYFGLNESPVGLAKHDDFFLAHEIAHQWWGQGVTFSSYRDQWLSEGLAQYSALSYIREKYGQAAFLAAIRKFSRWVDKKSYKGPVLLGSRLSHLDYDAYQTLVYNKPAIVLFMLEDLIGREKVWAGLRNYFSRYKAKAARTQSLIKVLEEAAGRELGVFFRSWLYSHNLPDVQSVWSLERYADGFVLKLRLTQTAGHFEFPLTVQWLEKDRLRRETVKIDKTTSEFDWRLSIRPVKFKLNPDGVVPGRFR